MEIAEAVAMNPPRRSVVFVTYTAEEMGLYGSHYFVNSGPFDTNEIQFNVNLDMIGRTTLENEKTGSHYFVANNRFMPKLRPFVEEINDESVSIPLIYNSNDRLSGSSDHVNFQNAGIPAFFFFSGMHQDLHQPGDDPEKIEYDKAVNLSKLSYLITMKLANMDKVPNFIAGMKE
jgi:Zn-dependent M28 family amino/carboxypeptidase